MRHDIICRVEGSQYFDYCCPKGYEWQINTIAQIKNGKQICGQNAEICKRYG
jgi:hypothetical protein